MFMERHSCVLKHEIVLLCPEHLGLFCFYAKKCLNMCKNIYSVSKLKKVRLQSEGQFIA